MEAFLYDINLHCSWLSWLQVLNYLQVSSFFIAVWLQPTAKGYILQEGL